MTQIAKIDQANTTIPQRITDITPPERRRRGFVGTQPAKTQPDQTRQQSQARGDVQHRLPLINPAEDPQQVR
jgi:hypothetical protein